MSRSALAIRDDDFQLWHYVPSMAGSVIFLALFALTTGYHIFQAAKKRTYYFIPLIVGGLFEALGYLFRIVAHSNLTSLNVYIMQSLFLLVAPALFAASIYMILGRLITFTHAEAMSPVRAKWMTKIFVCGDVFSFIVQAGGGGLMASVSTMETGKKIIIAGLFLQLVFFGFFLVCGILFHFRLIRTPTPSSAQVNWTKYMYALYAAGLLILVRSLFRVVEFTSGNDGTIARHEIFLYLFDGVLMFVVMVLFNVIHPGEIIGRKSSNESIGLSNGYVQYDAPSDDRPNYEGK